MSKGSDFFLAGAGSIYPIFDAVNVPYFKNSTASATTVEGFLGDGDYIILPNIWSGVLSYYNSADVLQWSKTYTNVIAAADRWSGFYFDETENLIYTLVTDNNVSPYRTYLATIDSAGTIVNIGSDQASIVGVFPQWLITGGPLGSMQRETDGSGNFKFNNGGYKFEMSSTTGLYIDNGTRINPGTTASPYGYHSTDDVYLGKLSVLQNNTISFSNVIESTMIEIGAEGHDQLINIAIPSQTGLGGILDAGVDNRGIIVEWKGYNVIVGNGTFANGIRNFDRAKFNKSVNALGRSLGVIE